jgi:hypothetical protein
MPDEPIGTCSIATFEGLSVARSGTSGERDIQTESSSDLSTQTSDGEPVPDEPTCPRSRLLVGPQILFGTVGVNNFPASQNVNGNVGVTGTVGIDPTSNHVNVDSLPAISGNVGLTGSLPAGTNNIGSVTIDRGAPYQVEELTQLSTSDAVEVVANRAGTTTGVQLESVSIEANVPTGEVLERCYVESAPTFVAMFVPMTKQGSDGSVDYYVGTVAIQLHVPAGESLVAFCNRPPNPNNGPMTVFVSFSGEQTPS